MISEKLPAGEADCPEAWAGIHKGSDPCPGEDHFQPCVVPAVRGREQQQCSCPRSRRSLIRRGWQARLHKGGYLQQADAGEHAECHSEAEVRGR